MHVADTILWQQRIAFWKSFVPEARGVSRIPIQKEILVGDRRQRSRGLRSGRGVAFVFKNKHDVVLRGFLAKFAQLLVHILAVRLVVFETPEVEQAHLVGSEVPGHGRGALKHLVLLRKRKTRLVRIALWA